MPDSEARKVGAGEVERRDLNSADTRLLLELRSIFPQKDTKIAISFVL